MKKKIFGLPTWVVLAAAGYIFRKKLIPFISGLVSKIKSGSTT